MKADTRPQYSTTHHSTAHRTVEPPRNPATVQTATQATAGLNSHSRIEAAKKTVSAYFAALNADEFERAAGLFAIEGQILPPFESAIVGREAIAAYLRAEAKGMRAAPQTTEAELLPTGETALSVVGQVQAPLFMLNVGWQFMVNSEAESEAEIVSVKIKLLATLKDLLHLKR